MRPRVGAPRLARTGGDWPGSRTYGLGLLGRSRCALGAARALGLVVVAGVKRTGQVRGRAGPELVGALQHPRLCLGVLREERRRRRHPDAGAGERAIGVRSVGAVGRAIACTAAATCSPSAMPSLFARTLGNGLDRGRVRLLDDGFLVGIELDQDVPGRRGRGRLRRCAGLRDGASVARVAALHRIDRVAHRDMHHRQRARPRIARDIAAFMTSIAVSFQSVTISARAVPGATAMTIAMTITVKCFMMSPLL